MPTEKTLPRAPIGLLRPERVAAPQRIAPSLPWSRRKKALVMTGLALGVWALLFGFAALLAQL